MRKIIISILLVAMCSVLSCSGQVNNKIVDYYKQKRYISFEEVLFTPIEFIELCKDSLGVQKLEKQVQIQQKINSRRTVGERNENNLLITLVKKSVKNVNIDDSLSILSKNFIIDKLESFNVEVDINSEFIYSRLNVEQKIEYCNTCISMFIFFVYDPELYSQVIKDYKDLFLYNIYFPLNMLQECDPPLELLEMRKNGILNLIKNSEDVILKQIFLQVSNCDITDRCN